MASDTLCFFSLAVMFLLQHSFTLLARPVMQQKANPKKWLLALSRGTNILHWILISMLEMCEWVHGTVASKDTSEGVSGADCWPHSGFSDTGILLQNHPKPGFESSLWQSFERGCWGRFYSSGQTACLDAGPCLSWGELELATPDSQQLRCLGKWGF